MTLIEHAQGSEAPSIRTAGVEDIDELLRLLKQVAQVHHVGRPDLFKDGGSKYDHDSLKELLGQKDVTVYVAQLPNEQRLAGYAFTMEQHHESHGAFQPISTLYVDDLCVDETVRGRAIGSRLMEHVFDVARQQGFYNVTLNVWACNPEALAFYKRCGMEVYTYGMERIVNDAQ
ncbi:GNAT family N-acetyltransferase [Bifidobacterium tsurumiense]|uniref:Acetyltransferase n=1 Tax=Bifidobacterium tsurumiense TaxID=356829 RepID=A0A087EFG4_9BIFI|nr:GNAT family N-acetyltransferase [Bifidobacterium tsurumiense]KFJ06515.1 acetyltransferase [Bifidobacterium tsurumiense]MDY4677256.1 GNAT family N-acetyltransferase [Bifidobacterium tsurumiense]MSS12828.1 GNAT family N-acetyltransferase [Bifidobacterium tsurumiense]